MADENKPNAQNTDTTQPAGGQQAAAVDAQPTQEKTFTQAELDRILNERLSRERSKYADYDTLKAKAEELESANKSELEKAMDKANKAEARAKEVEREAKMKTLRADATTIAVELGFDAKRLDKILRLVDINDESTAETLRTSLEALAGEMPELLSKKGAPSTGAINPAKPNEAGGNESAEAWYKRTRGATALDSWTGKGELYLPPTSG